jgi:hypothetical protein
LLKTMIQVSNISPWRNLVVKSGEHHNNELIEMEILSQILGMSTHV